MSQIKTYGWKAMKGMFPRKKMLLRHYLICYNNYKVNVLSVMEFRDELVIDTKRTQKQNKTTSK